MEKEKEKNLVSVIVPIYNVEQYLRECVDSIRNQTYQNLEIILVDDGSPDSCPAICDEYAEKDSRIKVIHKKNGGISDARNKGIENATGDFLIFIDSDDKVSLEMIDVLTDYLQYFDTDLVLCDIESEKYRESILLPWEDKTVFEKEEVQQILMASMIGNEKDDDRNDEVWGSVCRGIYKRKLIEEYNIRFPRNRNTFSEDLVFSASYLVNVEKAVICAKKMYYYRNNECSIMNSIELYSRNMFLSRKLLAAAIREELSKIKNNENLLSRAKVSERQYYLECIVNIFRKGNDHTKSEIMEELNDILQDSYVQKAFCNYNGSSLKNKMVYGAIKHKMKRTLYFYYKIRLKFVS